MIRNIFRAAGSGLMEVVRAAAILLFAFTCAFTAFWVIHAL